MEVDMVANMVVDKKIDIDINMEIQFGERVGHWGWLVGPKLFQPEVSFKLCESILEIIIS